MAQRSWIALIAVLLVAPFALSAPLIDNNAGIWTDLYNDNLGVQAVQQTVVDGQAGVVKLVAGQTSGDFTTVRIKPPSFGAWGKVTLDGTWAAPADVTVTLLDSSHGDAVISGFNAVPYTGPLNISSLSVSAIPEIRVKVGLSQGTVAPVITSLKATWTPISVLLIDKKAPAEVQAGQQIVYRVRYSVSYVEAQDVVVWDRLPNTAQATMTYPLDYGQDDNVTFVSATAGGQYTASATTVKGIAVPANSVYWDLGTKPEGTTETLTFVVKTKNGTLDSSAVTNTASADAANASPVSSAVVPTVIRSVPVPAIRKRPGAGILALDTVNWTRNFTRVNSGNAFTITARNGNFGSNPAEGMETMVNTVVYDNLTDLTVKIDPNFGGAGVPVTGISAGGTYVASYTPPAGGAPFPAVVWNVGTMVPGAEFTGTFSVKLLDAPPNPASGQYENTVTLDSARTRAPLRNLTPLSRSLIVKWPYDETPQGSFAKGDNLAGAFQINAARDDDALLSDGSAPGPGNPYLYVKPGGTFPYGLLVSNNGLSAMNQVVLLDKIPAGTSFKTAWFEDTWLQANAKIFYSTTDTVNADTPPAYDVTQAPSDLDPSGNTNWTDYAASPPADPSTVRWLAYYIPAINSNFFDSSSPGWVPGAPQSVRGYYNVTVASNILGADPCAEIFLNNRGLFRCHGFTPINGGPVQSATLSGYDDEPTRVSNDKPDLDFAVFSAVTPSVIETTGNVTFTTRVANSGAASAQNLQVELKWPRVPVNGVLQYLPFVSVTPSAISTFDPSNGRLVLSLGNLPAGGSQDISLTITAPKGLDFGQVIPFTATATATAACPVPPATTNGSAVANFIPRLRVYKNDVLDLIPSADFLDYTLQLTNTGEAPSHGTIVVDRVPEEMSFVSATGPQGERVWFSADDSLPPAYLSPTEPVTQATLTTKFSPGIKNDNGTPANPADDTWTSPFGSATHWVAWEMDLTGLSPNAYPVGTINTVGFRVKNDLDGTGPGVAGSPAGTQIFNTAATFSDELIQAIGNEVVTTIKDAPAIVVQKTGPSVVTAGETFVWNISYYNNSGAPDDVVTITDTLPAGVSFVSATHTWNAKALANGAPAGNNGKAVPTSTTVNPDGTTSVVFAISGSSAFRGDGTDLTAGEGGSLAITVQAAPVLASGSTLLNRVTGTATRGTDTSTSTDTHQVSVQNAELHLNKVSSPAHPIAGDTVTYNLLINNSGLHAAAGVVIADTLPAGLTFVPGSTLMLTPGYTIGAPAVAGQTLTWSNLQKTGLAVGIIPANSGDIVIQYRATVNAGTPPGTNLDNTATVTTTTTEDGTQPNNDAEQVSTPNPDPAVSKIGPNFITPGDRFTWTIQYWNTTRQTALNAYVIDTLPDYSGDGIADVTFVAQQAPAGVTPYYHAGATTSVPAFSATSPTTGGWSASPTSPVNHIAWVIGTLAGEAGPFTLTVTVDGLRASGQGTLPSAANLTNTVVIHADGTDQNPANNTDDHTTRTPGNDITLTKTGSSEGSFPGVAPGGQLTYTLTVENSGTQTAYGVEIQDTLPAQLQPASPADNAAVLSLTDALGNAVLPVDISGAPITGTVPITAVHSGNSLKWFIGTNTPADALYFRKIGIPTRAQLSFQVYTTISSSTASGTTISNSATAYLHNQQDSDPAEPVTSNNTDTSAVVVFRPDLAIRKSVRDLTTFDEQWTEATRLLEYRINYNNLGTTGALNSVISEIVPEGTSLVSVANPLGSTVTYYPGPGASGATSFDVNLGTIPAPANVAGVPQNRVFEAAGLVKLSNGNGGIPLGSFLGGDQVSNWGLQGVGDLDGDGVGDLTLRTTTNDDGATDAGAVWVVFLNANGTAKSAVELASGKNGIPAGSLLANDSFGQSSAPIGDIDGDGMVDLAVGAPSNDDEAAGSGAVWIIRLNANGSAKSAVEIANGKGGMASGALGADNFGTGTTGVGDVDGDGVPDVFSSAPYMSVGGTNTGGGWLLLLNSDGSAKATIKLANGLNGVPAGSFPNSGQVGSLSSASADFDGDGIGDIVMSNFRLSANAGGCTVILLNANGTAKSVRSLYNGTNGIPVGTFAANDWAGRRLSILGDVDTNGVPDLVLFIQQKKDGAVQTGGAAIIRMKNDGTALGVTVIANGMNGVPAGSFTSFEISDAAAAGDVNGDGVPDMILGANGMDIGGTDAGGAWLMLLNADGTVKAPMRLANGSSVPGGSFLSYVGGWVSSIGDINGDSFPDFALSGSSLNDQATSSGGAFVMLSGWESTAQADNTPSQFDSPNVSAGKLAISTYAGAVKNYAKLANGSGGITAGSFLGNDQAGTDVATIGDIDSDGVTDIVVSSRYNDDGATDAGGAWVVRLNSDGTAKGAVELANGKNGIPAGSFLAFDNAGECVVGLGDVDGDGVPDIGMGAPGNDDGASNTGAMWVVLLNSNGTAKNAIELANGKNGVSAGYFLTTEAFGNVNRVISLGDIDGDSVPDFLAGNPSCNDGGTWTGGAWIVRLNSNGTAKGITKLANGSNGISAGSFLTNDSVGTAVGKIGDIDGDGVPDIVLGSSDSDDGATSAGGVWIIRLNSNGTAKGVQEIANGIGGLPSGSLLASDFFGGACRGIGDIDADGIPDLAVGAFGNDDGVAGAGAVWILRLNSNGTAKSATELASGRSGIPNTITTNSSWGQKLAALGDVDGDGIPDLAASAIASDVGGENTGSIWVVLLNSDGSAKSGTQIQNGSNGLPAGSLVAYDYFGNGLAPLGDINSDGVPDIAVGAPFADAGASEAGSVWILELSPNNLYSTGSIEKFISANAGFSTWDRLFSAADIPEGTTLSYTVGRVVNGVATYDLGTSWTNIAGPLPGDGLDLSSLSYPSLVIKANFTTTQTTYPNALTPVIESLFATDQSSSWPGFTFTVRVSDPVPAGQTTIHNTASISTSTPETRTDNNTAQDDILIRLTDLEVTKTTDKAAALENETVTFTLAWKNNGPQDAVNAVLTDTLPAGLTFVSATPVPTSTVGQVLTWSLGDSAVGTSGTITVTATVNAGTAGQTLVNVARVDNDRQETDYTNNDDSVPVVVSTLANVWINKSGPATAALGGQVSYTLDYGNNGNTAALNTTVTDVLPAGLTFASATPAPDTVSGQTLTWNLGSLATGSTGSITVLANISSNYLTYHNTTLVNPAQIATTTGEVTLADNFDEHPVTVIGAPAAISGYVWFDRDNDGVKDPEETGISGTTLTLTGTDVYGQPVLLTQETGLNGYYSFSGLVPGTYQVVETQPSGYRSTTDLLGTVSGSPNGTNTAPLDDQLTAIALGSDARGIEYNFGETITVNLGNFIWLDADRDGSQDAEELGVAGAVVSLYLADGTTPATDADGVPVASQTTLAGGLYNFTNLFAGDYVVRVQAPVGYSPTTSGGDPDNDIATDSNGEPVSGQSYVQSQPVTLTANGEPSGDGDGPDGNLTVDFGFVTPADFADLPDTSASTGVADYQTLLANNGPYHTIVSDFNLGTIVDSEDDGQPTAAADGDGADEDGVSAFPLFLSGSSGSITVSITNPTGGVGAATLYGFIDWNGDGDFADANESTSVAVPDGAISVSLPYTVPPASLTGSDLGLRLRLTSDTLTLNNAGALGAASDGEVEDYLIQAVAPAALGNFVWNDANNNGLFDVGEAPLENVVVELLDGSGNPIDSDSGTAGVQPTTDTTDAAGEYTFTNLAPGNYQVRISTAPVGFELSSTTTVTTDNQVNNDDNGTQATLGGVTTSPVIALAAGETDNTLDFGFLAPATISGTVFSDDDNDNDGDTAMENVTLTLFTDPNGDGDPTDGVQVGSPVTTNASGAYSFTGLAPGSYVVVQTQPAGYLTVTDGDTTTPADDLANPSTTDNRIPVTVIAGETDTGNDFVEELITYALGNLVFVDANGNGVADSGEGVNGVTLVLKDSLGDDIDSDSGTPGVQPTTTVTSGGGFYLFSGLPVGSYIVSIPASEFSTGGDLAGRLSLTGNGIDNGTDDLNDENGVDVVSPWTTGISSTVIALGGTEPTATETGLGGTSDDGANDATTDLTADFGFIGGKATSFGGWQQQNPLSGNNGPTDDPDGDGITNLEEFAFCYDPSSGIGHGCPLELEVQPDGSVNAIVRELVASSGLTYTLQSLTDLSLSPGGWADVTSLTPGFTSNGDGTQDATYTGVDGLPALSPGQQGFFRVKVTDAASNTTVYTDVEGFTKRAFNNGCQTASDPYLTCPRATGTIGSVSASSLDCTASAGSGSFAAALASGQQHYIEITSGDNEGQRFEIDEAATTTTALAIDLGNPLNTSASLPASLAADTWELRTHHTINDLYPPSKFAATGSASTADRILYPSGTNFTTYWLNANGGSPKWVRVGDPGLADRGNILLPPCAGYFVHPKSGTVNLTFAGRVRANDMVCPLSGTLMLGGGWPLDQSPNARLMTSGANGFLNTGSPTTADKISLWHGDIEADSNAYDSWSYLTVAGNGRWASLGNATLTDQGNVKLFKSFRAAFIRVATPKPAYTLPKPWIP